MAAHAVASVGLDDCAFATVVFGSKVWVLFSEYFGLTRTQIVAWADSTYMQLMRLASLPCTRDLAVDAVMFSRQLQSVQAPREPVGPVRSLCRPPAPQC